MANRARRREPITVNDESTILCDAMPMGSSRCDICGQDISKPSLVRCQTSACPLRESSATASREMLVGLGGIGLVAALVVGGAAWFVRLPASNSGGGFASSSSGADNPVAAWIGRITARAPSQETPSAPSTDRPDWSASSRVQSFSCDGKLSDARAMICSNWDLARTDYNLSIIYRRAMMRARDPEALHRDQESWLAKIDGSAHDKEALLDRYGARIAQLQAR